MTKSTTTRGWLRLLLSVALMSSLMSSFASNASAAVTRSLGVYIPWSSTYYADVDAFTSAVGHRPGVVMWYRNPSLPLFDATRMNALHNGGSTPMVTFEPSGWSLASIASGSHDAYFTAAAATAKTLGYPFYLRFAHEMNGAWYAWGQQPTDYVNAWRHVRNLFDAAGVTNVRWFWCPNATNGSAQPVSWFFPGESYVDAVGIDTYNNSRSGTPTLSSLSAKDYPTIVALAPTKEFIIGETGTAEGSDPMAKANWIRASYDQATLDATMPRLTKVLWFDQDLSGSGQQDWRVRTSSNSVSAYRAVAQSAAWSGGGLPVTGTSLPTPTPVGSVSSALPAAPSSLVATQASSTTVKLTWKANGPATGFTIDKKNGSYGWFQKGKVSGTVYTFLSGGVTRGSTYYFRVRATNAAGSSSYSNVVTITIR